MPTQRVTVRREVIRARRAEFDAQPRFNLGLYPIKPLVVDYVLEAGTSAIRTIAIVPLNLHDGVDGRKDALHVYEANDVG